MKKSLLFVLMGFFVFDIAGGGARGCKRPQTGGVQGVVSFSGLPCQPGQADFNVPPCTGPYPSYKIDVYETSDPKTIRSSVSADAKGNFQIQLPSGEYVIFTQNGPKETNLKENKFNVRSGSLVNLNLSVSTGIQ